MRIFRSARHLTSLTKKLREKNEVIGFVPTMGALHDGHMSLIQAAKANSDYVIASIFVNPTQFNEASDLKKYPRTPSADRHMLSEAGCDLLFFPTISQMYPNGKYRQIDIDYGQLDQLMEGAHRPGHFAGVGAVVKRLLDIVNPSGLYMGQKDFQQTAIIAHMLKAYHRDIKLIICPTIRHDDGLAMSSRNSRLGNKERQIAPVIYATLTQVKKEILDNTNPAQVAQKAIATLNDAGLRPEYCQIVDGHTLQPIKSAKEHDYIVVCTAAWAGDVRLIDNVIIKRD